MRYPLAGGISLAVIRDHPPKQLWQPRDVDGDPTRLVFVSTLGLQRFGFTSRE
jgi:hypothetical protein